MDTVYLVFRTVNVVLAVIALILLVRQARQARRQSDNDWARIYLVALCGLIANSAIGSVESLITAAPGGARVMLTTLFLLWPIISVTTHHLPDKEGER